VRRVPPPGDPPTRDRAANGFDLTGHVALITGGNGGIGLGIARGLARAGARIAIAARDETKSRAAARELSELGAEVATFALDVAREDQVITVVRAAVERFGRIDSCFANAGFGRPAPFLEMSLADWNAVLAVNLTGVFVCFREVARHMVERGGGGKLIAITSIGAAHGMPREANYAASKGALISLVRSTAVALARHRIQVNALRPGWIETQATEAVRAHERVEQAVLQRTPARRWGVPGDLEGIAVYLASPLSDYQTGDEITIDGGYLVF
jgi:NAD(P)-dependent dehydrogenase (short-subunit alcohol dehydrogenase family)